MTPQNGQGPRRPVAQGEILAPPSWPGVEPIAKRLSRLLGSHDRVLRGAKFMGEHLSCGLSRSLTDSESNNGWSANEIYKIMFSTKTILCGVIRAYFHTFYVCMVLNRIREVGVYLGVGIYFLLNYVAEIK